MGLGQGIGHFKMEFPWHWPWLCQALRGFGQLPPHHPGAQGLVSLQSKNAPHSQGEYDVYSTFQSHEPEFDYLKSLEIEEKINKIKWLPQQNAAHSLLSTNGEAAGPVWVCACAFVCMYVCVCARAYACLLLSSDAIFHLTYIVVWACMCACVSMCVYVCAFACLPLYLCHQGSLFTSFIL